MYKLTDTKQYLWKGRNDYEKKQTLRKIIAASMALAIVAGSTTGIAASAAPVTVSDLTMGAEQ